MKNNFELANEFYKKWHSDFDNFYINTSGSTGDAKSIRLYKKWMIWSANQTKQYIKPTQKDQILCCLPLDKVGGLMMLVRGLVWEIPVKIIEPTANPLLNDEQCTIISLTPFQLSHILKNHQSKHYLNNFKHVIIGGGELSPNIEQEIKNSFPNTEFWHSYGMTETYSHIALRNVKTESKFNVFKDVQITINQDQCLVYKCPFDENWIETNDLIVLDENHQFEILGRKDFLINSGGIKLNPFIIENEIRKQLNPDVLFCISSKKDEALGNLLVLVSESDIFFKEIDLSFLKTINLYAVPKKIIVLNPFPLNTSNKIDRLSIHQQINHFL